MSEKGIFKGDKWNHLLGFGIPPGSTVELLKYLPKRKVLVEYNGMKIVTMLWCLK